MANDDLSRAFVATTPLDANDPPRFGQPTELTKDVLVAELRTFLSNAQQSSSLRAELPTVEKYSTFALDRDPLASATEVIRKLSDRGESLPHVAVMATTGSERKLTIGPPFIGRVQEPPRLRAALPEPYALTDQDILHLVVFRTIVEGVAETERVVFSAERFTDIAAATAQEVANEINGQCSLVSAFAIDDGADTYLEVRLGSKAYKKAHGSIEIGHETSTGVLTATEFGAWADVTDISGTRPDMELTFPAGTWSAADVGKYAIVGDSTKPHFNDGRFLITNYATGGGLDTLTITNKYGREEIGSPAQVFIGSYDDYTNPTRPPMNRYAMSWDLTVQIDVLVDDDNSRGELSDLVASFLGFVMERQYFTFMGRSHFANNTTTDEYFQIVFQPPLRLNSESETPRLNDGSDKVHITSFSLNCTTTQYLDRAVYAADGTTSFIMQDAVALEGSETLPVAGTIE